MISIDNSRLELHIDKGFNHSFLWFWARDDEGHPVTIRTNRTGTELSFQCFPLTDEEAVKALPLFAKYPGTIEVT